MIIRRSNPIAPTPGNAGTAGEDREPRGESERRLAIERLLQQAIGQEDRTVLALLIEAALAGQRCPSNDRIAGYLRASSSSTGSRMIAQLEDAGLIRVHRGQCARIIRIPALGVQTAGRIDALKPHWRSSVRRGEVYPR